MVKLDFLSDNLILILNELVNNQTIVKYLNYSQSNPQSQPNLTLPATPLMMKNVLPYPFDPSTKTDNTSQLHIYYPRGDIKNFTVIENEEVYFDIVVEKRTGWLINDGSSSIRPYMIMKEIIRNFDGKSIGTLGKLKFKKFLHVYINERFDCIRLCSEMFTLGH